MAIFVSDVYDFAYLIDTIRRIMHSRSIDVILPDVWIYDHYNYQCYVYVSLSESLINDTPEIELFPIGEIFDEICVRTLNGFINSILQCEKTPVSSNVSPMVQNINSVLEYLINNGLLQDVKIDLEMTYLIDSIDYDSKLNY